MTSHHARERLARLEELAVDLTTEGLSSQRAVELAELRHGLGDDGAEATREIENAAALVVLAARGSRSEPMPASLRRKLQERAFATFEGSTSSPPEAPSTTTGANTVSLEEAVAKRARPPATFFWAAAAALLLVVGVTAATRTTLLGGRAAPAAAEQDVVTVVAHDARLDVAWRGAPPDGMGSLHVFLRDETRRGGWRDGGPLIVDARSPSSATVTLGSVVALPARFRIAQRDEATGGPRDDVPSWEGDVRSGDPRR